MCKTNLRTYGIELEGYTSENIRDNFVLGWKLIGDGSLSDGREDCDYCNGEGSREHECPECSGSGRYECYHCEGYGDIECSDCASCGEVPCGDCDCTGKIMNDDGEEEDCACCEGSGYVTCSTCEGNGRYDCDRCEGSGNVECEDCDGEGWVQGECDECGGSGYYGDGDGGYGVECVSGINTEGNYDSIDTIFDYINRHDWIVNEDCGTHVHIGASDLTEQDLSRLYILQNIIEPFIFGISPSERIDGTYSKKTDRDIADTFMRLGDDIELQQIANSYYGYSVRLGGSFQKYDGARYFGLNLHSWFYRRSKCDGSTIEFRYFEGCDNREQAKAWIDLCVKLVDFAKHVTFEQLRVIGSEFFMIEDLTEYIAKVKELLSLEYNFRPYSNYAYDKAKNNIASCFRNTHVISRAV